MLIDIPSFAIGGLLGLAVAVSAWALSRWLTDRRARTAAPAVSSFTTPPIPVEAGSTDDPPPDDSATPPVAVSPEQVRLSERIVVALAREGRLSEELPARPVRTQAGLVEKLGSNQSAVSKVLRRLVAADVLTEERRHVEGRDQRLKVYALTRRGELLAREVARRRNLSLLPEMSPEGSGPPGLRPTGLSTGRPLVRGNETLLEQTGHGPVQAPGIRPR